MDFLLVLPLTLSFLTTGLSDTNDSKCITMCPAGSHRADKCMCQPCETGFYTEIPNERPKCLKCSKCKKHAEQIKACVPDSNVVCACKDGFYSDKPDIAEDCKRCPCEECRRNKITRKCEECDRCMNNSDCTRQCKLLPMTTSTTLSANLTTTVFVHGFTTGGSLGLHKAVNRVFWMILAAAVASLLVLLWLLLFCLEKLVKLSTRCPCWAEPKGQEPPRAELKSNKQFSHQNCSPCVMIFDTSEEPPSLSLSPANPEHPDSVAPLLPSAKQKDEQAEAWPAVVLYAIIREVPLRRWKEFLRLLSLSDQQMDRVELEAGLSSTERQYQMLRLWSMRSSACLGDVLCALHHMELSGCAQLLKESLEEMHWTTEVRLQVGATDPAGWHGEAVPGKNAT